LLGRTIRLQIEQGVDQAGLELLLSLAKAREDRILVSIVSALLRDVGELVLACKPPHQFCAALELARTTGCSQVEAEEQVIRTSHAEIGAYLLGLWGIDSLVVEAVAHHHRPNRIPHVSFDASAAVYVADRLAHEIDHNEHAALGEPDDPLLKALGLSQQYPALRERAMELFP
jgi:HD-like signal output (HDOD) protein